MKSRLLGADFRAVEVHGGDVATGCSAVVAVLLTDSTTCLEQHAVDIEIERDPIRVIGRIDGGSAIETNARDTTLVGLAHNRAIERAHLDGFTINIDIDQGNLG